MIEPEETYDGYSFRTLRKALLANKDRLGPTGLPKYSISLFVNDIVVTWNCDTGEVKSYPLKD